MRRGRLVIHGDDVLRLVLANRQRFGLAVVELVAIQIVHRHVLSPDYIAQGRLGHHRVRLCIAQNIVHRYSVHLLLGFGIGETVRS